MNAKVLRDSFEAGDSTLRPRAFQSVVYGGLAVGVLDGLAASISSLLRGGNPIRVFQYVASGVLGKEAFSGGTPTFLLGVLLHFVVALGAAGVYYIACLRFPVLLEKAVLYGPLYGIAVYFVMAYIISPMSLTARSPFSFNGMLIQITIHVLFVGLPIAFLARQSALNQPLKADQDTAKQL
ncbi:MAG: hypothetical protein H7070_06390 [Saprospiraceae bacterium]|nr:hypothetical protein [Pyrinomonadaceae bacterium]